MRAYHRPTALEDALVALGARPHLVLAGGTDVYPSEASALGWGGAGLDDPGGPPILDVSALEALSGIERFPDRVEIGALATWTDAIACDLPPWFDAVRLAAREVGGRQIQNRGTLAGNLCNASPAADGVPPLLALDARVRLQRQGGSREVPLDAFILGNRRTCIGADELLTAIVIPAPGSGARSTFLKLGARRYLVISVAMVAACVEVRGATVERARIAVGACSEVARRLPALESRLAGAPAAEAPDLVRPGDLAPLAPIDDVRAPGSYRRHGASILVKRALEALCRGSGGAP